MDRKNFIVNFKGPNLRGIKLLTKKLPVGGWSAIQRHAGPVKVLHTYSNQMSMGNCPKNSVLTRISHSSQNGFKLMLHFLIDVFTLFWSMFLHFFDRCFHTFVDRYFYILLTDIVGGPILLHFHFLQASQSTNATCVRNFTTEIRWWSTCESIKVKIIII